MYVPGLGQYTTPDPAHRASAMTPGPQTYSYARGRPLVLSDPEGRMPGERFRDARTAAYDSLQYAGGLSLLNSIEYGGGICRCCDDNEFYATKFVRGQAHTIPLASMRRAFRSCKSGDKNVAWFHSHPTQNVLSDGDKDFSVQEGDLSGPLRGFAVFPDRTFVEFAGWSDYLNNTRDAIPVDVFKQLFQSGEFSEAEFVQ
jgi:hypothetical protein